MVDMNERIRFKPITYFPGYRYPCFENPYPMDIHESPVTACQYFADCQTDLIPALYSVGSSKQKRTGFSEKVGNVSVDFWFWFGGSLFSFGFNQCKFYCLNLWSDLIWSLHGFCWKVKIIWYILCSCYSEIIHSNKIEWKSQKSFLVIRLLDSNLYISFQWDLYLLAKK